MIAVNVAKWILFDRLVEQFGLIGAILIYAGGFVVFGLLMFWIWRLTSGWTPERKEGKKLSGPDTATGAGAATRQSTGKQGGRPLYLPQNDTSQETERRPQPKKPYWASP